MMLLKTIILPFYNFLNARNKFCQFLFACKCLHLHLWEIMSPLAAWNLSLILSSFVKMYVFLWIYPAWVYRASWIEIFHKFWKTFPLLISSNIVSASFCLFSHGAPFICMLNLFTISHRSLFFSVFYPFLSKLSLV